MLWSKMQCAQCEHYRACSLRTKMFVNYCGSRKEHIQPDISAAMTDCRNRRAFVVKYRRPSMLALAPGVHQQA